MYQLNVREEQSIKALKKTSKIVGIIVGVLVLLIAILSVSNQIALGIEANKIVPNGQLIDMGDYNIHVYTEGKNFNSPTLVLLSGSATVAPVYDFKPLYSLLSDEYRIAVVEKAGYGYSDISDVPRDVGTMVEEIRNALIGADIVAPYVLLPHSMSGLEAIYWAQKYPDEVAGIVGIDMANPYSYDEFDFGKVNQMVFWGGTAVKLGLIRIPGMYPLNTDSLTEDEIYQQKLLSYRNAVNIDYIRESKAVYENSRTVLNQGEIICPVLLFSSNGKEVGDFWIPSQERFTQETDAQLKIFDCGHYIHYYKSSTMAEMIKGFVENLT